MSWCTFPFHTASYGSFYWHFADRRALVEAAAIIAESERGATADDKLKRLIGRVSETFAGAQPPGELLLYLQAQDEGVLESVERVVAHRLDYVTGLLAELASTAARHGGAPPSR